MPLDLVLISAMPKVHIVLQEEVEAGGSEALAIK